MYRADPDPWRFGDSPYEAGKYAATLAAMGDGRFPRALEVGCSIGIFTGMLARRCERLVAIDVSDTALGQARRRLEQAPHVSLHRMQVPDEWPGGRFNLLLLSEVLYYLDRPDLARLADRAKACLEPGGLAVLVHWIGGTDYPLSGDEAAEQFIRLMRPVAEPAQQTRHEKYRLDVLVRPGRQGTPGPDGRT